MMRSIALLLTLSMWLAPALGKEPIVVYLAGDSTMAQKLYEKRPETGWGEQLQQFFKLDEVRIENHARNGRSTRTFIAEGRWTAIEQKLKAGDFVFIQFGHNDASREKLDRYTSPQDYRINLLRFVADVRAKQATPVLLTPVMRRRFDSTGKAQDSHGEYPEIVRDVAKELKAPLLDMHRDSFALLAEYGVEKSQSLFMILQPGDSVNYPQGLNDNTHFTPAGALAMAQLAVQAIKTSELELKKHLSSVKAD